MDKLKFNAVVFDLDGVITKTAVVHAAAWKKMFDEYMKIRAKREGGIFKEFTYKEDYLTYVDGKPRYKGVQSFLESRNIRLEYGDPSDSADRETVCGLGNRKNDAFRQVLEEQGVEVYPSTVDLITALKSYQIHVGVASSSKNCQYILRSAKLEHLFETRVDGVVSAELGLQGKPQGDIFVRAAENMGCKPAQSIVVEDAVSGVQAGKNGQFALVIGVAREHNQKELANNGADIVVEDFAGVTVETVNEWFNKKNNP